MSQAKISVIIPVYKVEQYLSECIDSVLRQSYENLEIILVDDGSPDRCGEICEQYKKKDTRIQVIHKENGGLSDARNVGLIHASGDYISFIDSDDYLLDSAYETMIALLLENNAEIVIGENIHIIEGKEQEEKESIITVELLSGDEVNERLMSVYEDTYCIMMNKLFKRQLFDSISFPKGRINEDESVIYKLYDIAHGIVKTSQQVYGYRMRPGSITKSPSYLTNLDAFIAWEERMDYFHACGKEKLEMITYRYSLRMILIRYRMIYERSSQSRQPRKELKKIYDRMYPLYASSLHEIKYRLFRYFPVLYCWIVEVKDKRK